MKTVFTFFILFISSLSLFGQITVVIDPGHGGNDPGHCGSHAHHATEKEINLKIANFLGGYIEKYLQNVNVIYTRTTDTYPSLGERVDLANRNRADYFISIHCNGNDNSRVKGTETHVHSLDISKSAQFAKNIETEFTSRAGRKSRGIKDEKDLQHSLQVLKYTNMTSVLVECGFMTNPEEARYLNSTHGQEIIASAIFRAFRTTIEQNHPSIAFRKSTSSSSNNSTQLASNNPPSGYMIQVASSKHAIDTKDYYFKKTGLDVTRKELNTSSAYKYVYYAGSFSSKEEAERALNELKNKGYKDALIVRS